MNTLPDYIDHGLAILSIGLNPSTISVEKGFYFANPRNRFWRALNASGLIPEETVPGRKSQEKIFRQYGIGFTDVVKRHSPTGKALKASDYKKWAPGLREKIEKYKPGICWFHGKMAAQNFFKYTEHDNVAIAWGKQSFQVQHSAVFVTPNPSPANAVYSLQEITDWYKKLAVMVKSESLQDFPLV